MDPIGALSLLLTRILLFFVNWINPRSLENGSETTDSGSETTGSDEKSKKSDEDKTKELDESKTQKPCGEYLKRWQLWSRLDEEWEPYDPSGAKPEEKVEGKYYFHVIERFRTPYTPPSIWLGEFSNVLSALLQATIGGDFYYNPQVTPDQFFEHLKKLRLCVSVARKASTMDDLDDLDANEEEIMKGFGRDPDLQETTAERKAYLAELIKQLEYLLAFVEKEFQPTADRLTLAVSHGRISYDLLMFFFLPGDDILTVDMDDNGRSDNQPTAFTLNERGYDCFDKIGKAFYLQGYGVEWDGTEYKQYSLRRLIPKFPGTKNIDELICSVLTDEKKTLLQARGALYASLSGIHYKSYRSKRVMIDRRAFNNPDGYLLDPDQTVPEVEQSRLHLLAPHVYGFNLGSKKWMNFIVTELKDVVFDEDAWEHLVLEQKTKDLIQALVEVSRNSNSNRKIISDVISGKGGGLISVLHGPPGTGKTLTAEGVAELLKRPLYMVGATELSLKPHEMERSLKSVLSLATAWDAVLLIDEADVFLEARSLHELDRNALVSVALRVLEYHKGVLFLTTNRISSFDDAFLSRFSIAIKYPPLEKDRRLIVWRRFFELAGCSVDQESDRVTMEDLDWLASKPFNGRTVKNLVRTAQSLALSRNEPLSAEHVKTVVEVQEKFLSEFAQISNTTAVAV